MKELKTPEIKPYRCPTPGCLQRFETKNELDNHFKENKTCKDMAKRIKDLAIKGFKFKGG